METMRAVARAIEGLGLTITGMDTQTGVLIVKIPTLTGTRLGSLNEE